MTQSHIKVGQMTSKTQPCSQQHEGATIHPAYLKTKKQTWAVTSTADAKKTLGLMKHEAPIVQLQHAVLDQESIIVQTMKAACSGHSDITHSNNQQFQAQQHILTASENKQYYAASMGRNHITKRQKQ